MDEVGQVICEGFLVGGIFVSVLMDVAGSLLSGGLCSVH